MGILQKRGEVVESQISEKTFTRLYGESNDFSKLQRMISKTAMESIKRMSRNIILSVFLSWITFSPASIEEIRIMRKIKRMIKALDSFKGMIYESGANGEVIQEILEDILVSDGQHFMPEVGAIRCEDYQQLITLMISQKKMSLADSEKMVAERFDINVRYTEDTNRFEYYLTPSDR